MLDLALSENGTKIGLATSSDEEYPPENIIDGKTETFWTMTGLFPQEFVLSFPSLMEINEIAILCCNVADLRIESSMKSSLDNDDWNFLAESTLPMLESELTEEKFLVNAKVQYLRFLILSGHDSFASVHKVTINGTSVR
ncbi:intraflagellar transport protein 25 homolog [Octopus bimaculoides]|uniref:F5/8 type C domain-containing protein n=1 Tax=Octopus bimaculoides TaxID=37653 RepID=A0A0L8HGW7_OCTBM|nr:intraflagellar transport protein 25 homolog [Octopus bimaculoides]|eukprot:XP_014772409.1 PREDICTED: intraflagellar transport protein 25 homolog [Octopus bimaculoides]